MSSRTIPAGLANHLQQPSTTIAYLLKVTPLYGADPFGITSLDQDIVYDDGNGALTYRASVGYTPSDFVSDNALTVDNGEA